MAAVKKINFKMGHFGKRHFITGFCVLSATIFLGVKLVQQENNSNQILKIGYYLSNPVSELDTTQINDVYQSILLDNLNGKLVELNSDGQLVTDLAEKFWFEKNKLIFSFSDSFRTSQGRTISAGDAELSIKRTLLKGSTHVQLKSYLCTDGLNELNDKCKGIYVENGQLILEVQEPSYLQFILPMLTAVEFSIFPKNAFDESGKIINSYRETTGPYFIEKADGKELILKANSFNSHIESNSPQEIHLKLGDMDQIERWLQEGLVDTLTTTTGATREWEKLLATNKFNISETGGIKVYYLQFTPSGLQKTTFEQRALLANQIQEIMESAEYGFNPRAKRSIQFFQEMGSGHLNEDQKQTISNMRRIGAAESLKGTLKFISYNFLKEKMNFFKHIKQLEFIWVDQVPPNAFDANGDVYLLTNDTTFNEDITLMSYNFAVGTFGASKEEGIRWLKSYMNEQDVKKRMSSLNQMHFEALKKGVIFPLFSSPYSVLSRKPWKIQLSHFFSDTKFFNFRKSK